MTEQPIGKKGMSKGCKVSLIVGGVLAVLLIASMVVCYAKKDDLAKFGAATLIQGMKAGLIENPVAGLDTTQFNALADAFVVKMNEAELDYDKYQKFFNSLQAVPQDEKIDSDEIEIIVDGMIDYFPDLEELRPSAVEVVEPVDEELTEDSTEETGTE